MVGTTISHYRITEKLGEGGMGVVYKAEDTKLDRAVALKFLAPRLLSDQEGRKRFEREAKAAAKLDHPNICTVYEIDEVDGRTFIAMAFLEGRPLNKRIQEGPLHLPEALAIAIQIAEGLEAAHDKGITHRDIKPENVMLMAGSRGLIKLMDFGLAQLAGSSKFTREGTRLGTVEYMSPEQVEGAPTGHATDIWSLGVVLYEMIAGQRPFRGDFDQAVIYSILNEPAEPLTTLRSNIPIELDWVIEKTLAKDPGHRYLSVAELVVDLAAIHRKVTEQGSTRLSAPRAGATGRFIDVETGQVSQPSGEDPLSRELSQTVQRRHTRDLLLHLGGQGLLPDSVLAEALDVLARDWYAPAEMSQRRRQLLNNLLYERLRVGEFVEEWHRLERTSEPEETEATEPPATDRKSGREYRTGAEFFGLPLLHVATGVDSETGEPRVAKGLLAIGRVAVGIVAFGSRFAAGLMAFAPVSMGALSLGIVAVGGETVGLIPLGMPWRAMWGFICLTFVIFPAWRYLRARHIMPNVSSVSGGVIDGWAVCKKRVWRNDSRCFHGGSVLSLCGSYDVDLSSTETTQGRAILDASVVCGSARVRVPPTWNVTVGGRTIFGEYADKTAHPMGRTGRGGPKLLLTGFVLFGAVTIQK